MATEPLTQVHAGAYRDRVTFQRIVNGTWTDVKTVWARVWGMMGKTGSQVYPESDTQIAVRWTADLDAKMRIKLVDRNGTRFFHINDLQDIENRHWYILLTCRTLLLPEAWRGQISR